MLLFGLYGLWIIFNGHISLEIMLIGIPVTALVYALMHKAIHFSFRQDLMRIKRLSFLFVFSLVLLKQTLFSALIVMKRIWTPVLPDSAIIHFDPELASENHRVLFANAITLTPGTITVRADEKQFLVHCLDASSSSGQPSGKLYEMIRHLEA